MKYALGAAALVAATASAACTNDAKNWYCNQVHAITYTGVGGTGSYNRVTSMDSSTENCGSQAQAYSGSMSPLNEEVSPRTMPVEVRHLVKRSLADWVYHRHRGTSAALKSFRDSLPIRLAEPRPRSLGGMDTQVAMLTVVPTAAYTKRTRSRNVKSVRR